jgi:hypothetical protein
MFENADANSWLAKWQLPNGEMAADAQKIAEMSGHPLAYGLCLVGPGFGLVMQTPAVARSRDEERFWKNAVARLESLRGDRDPLTRIDAAKVLILVRSLVYCDFAAAKPLLEELPGDDASLGLLASIVFGELEDEMGLGDFMARKLTPTTADDHFVLAKSYEFGGELSRVAEMTRIGLQKFPADVRLNLLRTSLLLREGKAADLMEVHLRLSALEADFATRLKSLTDADREPLQLLMLHRAAYLALVGRPEHAIRHAQKAQELSEEAAAIAANLAYDLSSAMAATSSFGADVLQTGSSPPSINTNPSLPPVKRTQFLPEPESALPPKR